MTSTVPSKKPYRKAPPQHREIHHELPILCDEYDGVILAEQNQSSSDKKVAVCQGELNLKSWNLSSAVLPSWKVEKQSMKYSHYPSQRWLSKFMSQSVETLMASGDEGQKPICSFKSRSSLMFKEPAEVLAPRKVHIPTTHLPLKGILKQTKMLNVQPQSLGTSNSVETLSQSQQSQPYNDPQPCLRRHDRHASECHNVSSSEFVQRKDKKRQEKLQFSKFLDEITHRVLSPVYLHSLGEVSGEERIQKSFTVSKCSTRKGQKESLLEGTKQIAKKSPCLAKRREEWRREGLEIIFCHRKTPEEMDRTPRQRRKLALVRKVSTEKLWSLEKQVDLSQYQLQYLEPLTDAERIKLLQHDNEELRRRLAYVTNKMEAMERELESGQDYLEMELGQNREELEKFKDKFRRLQNSYTASQRTNQDLEEKLHALASLSQNWIFAVASFRLCVFLFLFTCFSLSSFIIKKAEMDRKTLDWEIVELTNKLLDAKTTINKLEELNERYRLDCNLAVQLLKCNKSHFRNHKFADLPSELQDMVNKHLQNTQDSVGPNQEDLHTLVPSDVVPTSVIARVLEKPESLVLNSAKSSSGSCSMAEDVFVHVDMSGTLPETCVSSGQGESKGKEGSRQQNGSCKSQNCLESLPKEVPTFEKLSPYPTPPPPHPMYPGRKVIEFSEDKVRIPKNSPLPNCTYATRQAISLSLVQGEDENCDRQRPLPSSPASGQRSASSCSYQPSPKLSRVPGSSQSSPFSSPPQVPSTFASSASSEEDLLANWQRMFVDKAPPATEQVLVNRTAFSRDTAQELQKRFSRSMQELGRVASAYSDGEESVQSCSWTVSRDSSVDIDSTEFRSRRNHFSSDYSTDFSQDESCKLLQGSGTEGMAEPVTSSPEKSKDYIDYPSGSPAEEQELLLQDRRVNSQEGVSEHSKDAKSKPPPGRPHRSPKRMGVHHLHRKDSLTHAQEQGNLLT
ncbi:hypothetical protein E2320_018874 [Naja naja]|nr:hypothetical protein E2320_018874 [Naja naja]